MVNNRDYSNAKIYKIVSNITGEQYYGSTCKPTLAMRLARHKEEHKRYINGKSKRYYSSFKILETDNYDIVLVEQLIDYKTKDQVHQRERFYIDNNECVNKNRPIITEEEKKQKQKENSINYYNYNQNKIKDFYRDNQDKIKYNSIQYYKVNKEKINERKYEKIDCECGSIYTRSTHCRHIKSKKHKQFIECQEYEKLKSLW